jgi:S1-C subfamily serine protease
MTTNGPSDSELERLRRRAKRALGDNEADQAVAKVRAIVGPGQIPASEADAQSAWNKLRNGDAPTPNELQALELVIRLLRPAPLSIGGNLGDLPEQQGHNLYPQDLKDAWAAFRTMVKPLLYSVGRVNLTDGTHIGTGFLVADGVLATNRHVLDDLTFGTGMLAPGRAQVLFQHEKGAGDRPEHIVAIEGVVRVHEHFDIALLAVPKLGRPIVDIDTAGIQEGHRVAAIGYPAKDEVRNPLFTAAVFGRDFGFKRAALGEVLDGTRTPALFHDCSTLGGNSGSPVFSLETGRVVAIHRAGFFMYRNEAVDGASLKPFATS